VDLHASLELFPIGWKSLIEQFLFDSGSPFRSSRSEREML